MNTILIGGHRRLLPSRVQCMHGSQPEPDFEVIGNSVWGCGAKGLWQPLECRSELVSADMMIYRPRTRRRDKPHQVAYCF